MVCLKSRTVRTIKQSCFILNLSLKVVYCFDFVLPPGQAAPPNSPAVSDLLRRHLKPDGLWLWNKYGPLCILLKNPPLLFPCGPVCFSWWKLWAPLNLEGRRHRELNRLFGHMFPTKGVLEFIQPASSSLCSFTSTPTHTAFTQTAMLIPVHHSEDRSWKLWQHK